MFGLGPVEIVLIGALAVMLYGKRLPEVGRSIGQSIAELRRQWSTIARDLDVAAHLEGRPPRSGRLPRQHDGGVATTSSPRFDPPAE